MSKYKQTILPIAEDLQFEGMKLGQLKEYVRLFFNKNLRNTSVINKHKGMRVQFSRKGFDHLIHARNVGYVKLKAVVILKEMIENAVYLNFKNKDEDDLIDILGYFNFKCKAQVENKIQVFRIVIRLTKDGKFYYDHGVKVKK